MNLLENNELIQFERVGFLNKSCNGTTVFEVILPNSANLVSLFFQKNGRFFLYISGSGFLFLKYILLLYTGSLQKRLRKHMLLFFPFRVSHSWPAKVLVLPIVAFAILYNIPKFFELRTKVPGSGKLQQQLIDQLNSTVLNGNLPI